MRFVPTGSPRLRSSRANPTSIEAAESSEASGVVVAEHLLQMRDDDLLVLVVLYNRAQRLQSRLAFELVGTEEGQCVRPVDDLGDGDLEVVDALPRATVADQFGLEERVERLGEGVVIGVSGRSDRSDGAGLGESLGVPPVSYTHLTLPTIY